MKPLKSKIKTNEMKEEQILNLFEQALGHLQAMSLDGQNDLTNGQKAENERRAQAFLNEWKEPEKNPPRNNTNRQDANKVSDGEKFATELANKDSGEDQSKVQTQNSGEGIEDLDKTQVQPTEGGDKSSDENKASTPHTTSGRNTDSSKAKK